MDCVNQVLKVVHCPEQGIYLAKVGDVVAEVLHRALVDGREPDRAGAELDKVVQPGLDALDVPDAVPIGILLI